MTSAELAWFGPEYIERGWAPAPRYLLRRARILNHMKKMPPGDLVEIGCASGALLAELAPRGFQCVGVEMSGQALSLAREVNKEYAIGFRSQPDETWREMFDYCLAFEVLEHIDDDRAAMRQWAKWLRPGGTMLLSVPAHPKLWNARDIKSGHFRRYRRAALEAVITDAGLDVVKVESYGFPLANILELLFAGGFKPYPDNPAQAVKEQMTRQTQASGIERSKDIAMFGYYARFPGSLVMRAMILLQALFVKTALGNGYLVAARKPLQD